jgi:hypothetical protein
VSGTARLPWWPVPPGGGLEDPLRRHLVRSWPAATEDLVHQWVREPATSRDELLGPPTDLLERLLD